MEQEDQRKTSEQVHAEGWSDRGVWRPLKAVS